MKEKSRQEEATERMNILDERKFKNAFTLMGPKNHDRAKDSWRERHMKSAFTLIELIVVMAVIGILVLLAAPKFLGYSDKARTTQITNDIKVLETKIDEYLINHETFLDTFTDGIPGDRQLYDRTGKIEVAPGDLKVVDGTFYPETNLGGNFYSDKDGNVVYEDDGNGIAESNPQLSDEQITSLVDAGYIPVANADELNQIRKDGETLAFGINTMWAGSYEAGLDKKYIQVADIDLISYSEGTGWFPLGHYMEINDIYEDFYFTGVYNGGNFAISNLTINRPDEAFFGLFGQLNGAELTNIVMLYPRLTAAGSSGTLVGFSGGITNISNIKITGLNMTITGGNSFGGMIGYTEDGSSLENLSVQGIITINSEAEEIGGLIGWNVASIYDAHTNVNIIDNSGKSFYVGGLIGMNEESTIEKAYAEGDVQGNLYVGGLIGWANKGTILNSYSTGAATGNDYVGGLVGELGYGSDGFGSIINSHSVSEVIATGTYVGGLVGYKIINGIITDSYYYQGPNNSLGTQVTELEMTSITAFSDWDFDTIWDIDEKPHPTFSKY